MRAIRNIINLLAVALLPMSAVSPQVFAGTGSIYISPSSSSLQVGNAETVSLRINPGAAVDGVQATVSFNPSYLRLNSVDNSSSPFGTQLQKSVGSSSVTIALGSLSGSVSSDSLIAYLNFTALVSSGSASLTVSNANATSSGTYINPAASGALISFTAPPVAAPAPAPISGGTSAKTYSAPKAAVTASQPTAAVAAPAAAVVEPIKITDKLGAVTYTTATVHATTNRAVNLYAVFGTDAANLSDKTSVANAATAADITLGEGGKLVPGTDYYYQVIAEDADGSLTKSDVGHLLTTGYVVNITVLDAHNRLLANTKVSLHSRVQTATTDANGVAKFMGVAPGVHHIEYAVGQQTYSAVVYVENTIASAKNGDYIPPVQIAAAVLPYTATNTQPKPAAIIAISVGGLLAIGGIAYVLLHRRFKTAVVGSASDNAGVTSVKAKKTFHNPFEAILKPTKKNP